MARWSIQHYLFKPKNRISDFSDSILHFNTLEFKLEKVDVDVTRFRRLSVPDFRFNEFLGNFYTRYIALTPLEHGK
jgi:hypothetical protein